MTRVFKGTLGFEKGCVRKGPGSMERGAQGRGMGEGCGEEKGCTRMGIACIGGMGEGCMRKGCMGKGARGMGKGCMEIGRAHV